MPSVRRCPMLGLKDDEHTRLAFASESHACYRTGKPKSISVDHQRQFCLEKEHTSCPIFLNAGVNPRKVNKSIPAILPKSVIGDRVGIALAQDEIEEIDESEGQPVLSTFATKKFARFWEITGVVIFLAFLLVGWWLFNNRDLFFPNNTPVQASIVNTSAPSETVASTEMFFPNAAMVAELTANPLTTDESGALISPTVTNTPSPTITSTVSPSHTPLPSLTPSPTAKVCVPPVGWVLYTVHYGETLNYFANYFGFSIESLMQANCFENDVIVYGQQIYLPWTVYPPTRTPSRTATSTATNRPAVPSSTRTFTPISTLTSTDVITNTALPPTSTPLPTNTEPPPLPTATNTQVPTATNSRPTIVAPPTFTPIGG